MPVKGWRSPGEVWRAYEETYGNPCDDVPRWLPRITRVYLSEAERELLREEAARIDYTARSGGRDLV